MSWRAGASLLDSAGGQMAERLGNRAINQKVAGSIAKMMLCPWVRHFTLLASGENKSLWKTAI